MKNAVAVAVIAITELEDDLAAAHTSLRRTIRARNRPTTDPA